jgi:hypothetical protein
MRSLARLACLSLAAAAAIHARPLLSGGLSLPVSPRLAPPWAAPGTAPSAPQDGAGTDKIVFNLPNWHRIASCLREDPRGLLWNPSNLAGIPFLATADTAVLYPLSLLALLGDPVRSMALHAFLHTILAILLAAIWLRSRGHGEAAAFAGGLAFGGGAWMAAHADTIQFVQAAAWTPLLLLGVDAVRAGRLRRGSLTLAAATAFSILGGMPQVTILALLAAGLWLILGSDRRSPLRLRGLGAAGLGVVLGLLLAAPQILPTLECAREARRLHLGAHALRQEALHPVELASLLLPGALGIEAEVQRLAGRLRTRSGEALRPDAIWSHPGRPLGAGDNSIERACGPGLVLGLLALAGALRARGRGALAALGLCAAAVLVATGTPALDAAASLPGLSFASPKRWIFIPVLLLPLFVAQGFAAAQAGRRALLAFVAASALLLAVVGRIAPEGLSALVPGAGPGLAPWLQHEFMGLGAAAALLLVALALPRTTLRSALILLLAVLDAAILEARVNPIQPREDAFFESRTERALQTLAGSSPGTPRFVRFKDPALDLEAARARPAPLPPNLNLLHGLRDIQGYEAILDRHVEDVLDTVEPGLVVSHHLARELRQLSSLQSPVLDLLAVRYVLSSGPLPLPGVALHPDELTGIFERPTALPRATIPDEVVALPAEEDVLRALGRPDFEPARRTYLTEATLASLGEPEAPRGRQARVVIEVESGAELRLRYSAWPGAFLRIADTFHAGWRAHADGELLPIGRADHMLRVIRLPRSEGTLVLRYEPWTFAAGSGLAGIGLVIFLLLLARRPAEPAHA